MSLVTFRAGVLTGAAIVAALLAPRLRAAIESARAAGVELRLAAERVSAHERKLEELRATTAEKIALVAGNREQLADQMKAISAGRSPSSSSDSRRRSGKPIARPQRASSESAPRRSSAAWTRLRSTSAV